MSPISGINIANFVTKMTANDAMGPIIALEATVTGGRTIQAYKRGGKDEARERLIEEGTGAIVWLFGVKLLNEIGDVILKKFFGENFDVGTDKVLRTPFENFMKNKPPKKFSAKQIAGIKAGKVLASVLLADAFIGLVVPPLNQKLTRKLKNKEENFHIHWQEEHPEYSTKKQENHNPSFKGGLSSINVFTNFIEKTNTGKLLSTDAGLVSGRMYSARNNDERREIAIRDIGSIYFYMWAQGHVGNLMNFIETGRFTRLNPTSVNTLTEHLSQFLEANGGEMGLEEFRSAVFGKNNANLPEGIKFESGDLSWFEKQLNRFRNVKAEPLQVAKVKDLEAIFTEPKLFERIKAMSELQPLRQGEAVITKQQILDAINVAEINNPELLDKMFTEFTEGASKNEYKFVSNKKLYNLKSQMEDYINDICKHVKDGKINKEVLKKAKNRNLAFSGLNFATGFVVAAAFLSTLIPKFQYWVTKQKTGRDSFPGLYEFENKISKTV